MHTGFLIVWSHTAASGRHADSWKIFDTTATPTDTNMRKYMVHTHHVRSRWMRISIHAMLTLEKARLQGNGGWLRKSHFSASTSSSGAT